MVITIYFAQLIRRIFCSMRLTRFAQTARTYPFKSHYQSWCLAIGWLGVMGGTGAMPAGILLPEVLLAQPPTSDYDPQSLPMLLDSSIPNIGMVPSVTDDQSYNFRPPTLARQPDLSAQDYAPITDYDYQWQYQPQQPRKIRPQLELTINNNQPYVQENLILTLRVLSTERIEQMDPSLPLTQALTFQSLLDPRAYTVQNQGQTQTVNEMYYMVTPLTAGTIELPISINITIATGTKEPSKRLTIQASQPLHLDIRPQVAGVLPWLPLEQLELRSNIKVPPEVEPGKPITLVLRLLAAGAIGNQLPSLEKLLQSADFRIYRGKTTWEGGPSENFRHVMGTRTEHYTLVPQYSGKLRLPSLRIPWFNIKTAVVEHTNLPLRTLASGGDSMRPDQWWAGSGRFLRDTISSLWIPLVVPFTISVLLIGYWLGVRYNSKPVRSLASLRLKMLKVQPPLKGTANWIHGTVTKLAAIPYVTPLLQRLFDLLPMAIKFWLWIRIANTEQIPALWRRTLQSLSWRYLTLAPHAACPNLALRIVHFHPGAELTRLQQLFKTLDSATYGKATIDFERWKQDLELQVRPGLAMMWRNLKGSNPNQSELWRLPPLNPC